MASPAFESFTTPVFQASGTTITLAAPSGVVDNNILLALLDNSADATVPSLAGWTAKAQFQNPNNGRYSNVLWKRASSESGSYGFTVPNVAASGTILRISGCILTGDPFTGTPVSTGYINDGGAAGTASGSMTPAVNDALLLYWLIALDDETSVFTGGGLTWDERVDAKDSVTTFLSTHVATAPQATAGAVDASCTIVQGGFRTAHLMALAPLAGGGGGSYLGPPALIANIIRNRGA